MSYNVRAIFPVYFFTDFIVHLLHEYIYLSCLKIWERNCWRIVIARANLWGVQILCFKRWNFCMTNKVLSNLQTFKKQYPFQATPIGKTQIPCRPRNMRAELQRSRAQSYIESKGKNTQLAIVNQKIFVGFKKKNTFLK